MNLTLTEQMELIALCHNTKSFELNNDFDEFFKNLIDLKNKFRSKFNENYIKPLKLYLNSYAGKLTFNENLDATPLINEYSSDINVFSNFTQYMNSINEINNTTNNEPITLNNKDLLDIFIKLNNSTLDYKITDGNLTELSRKILKKLLTTITNNKISIDEYIKLQKTATKHNIVLDKSDLFQMFKLLDHYSINDLKMLINNNINFDCNQYNHDFILNLLKDDDLKTINIDKHELLEFYKTSAIKLNYNDFKEFLFTAKKRNIDFRQTLDYEWLFELNMFSKTNYNRVFDHISKGFKPKDSLINVLTDLNILPNITSDSYLIQRLIEILYSNNIKLNPIIDFLNDETNKTIIETFMINNQHRLNDLIKSTFITNKKDANLIKKIITSNTWLPLPESINKLLQHLNIDHIDLIDVYNIYNHYLFNTIINLISPITKNGLSLNEKIMVAKIIKHKNISNDPETIERFIKKHNFNINQIKKIAPQLKLETIIKVSTSNFSDTKINYLLNITNDRYIEIIINNFDINKTVLENIYNNILESHKYKTFIELTNNYYKLNNETILKLYLNDGFDIFNEFIGSSNNSESTKKLYKSMFKAYIHDYFKDKKFETLDLELDETIPKSILNLWTLTHEDTINDYNIFETIDLNLTMKIGQLPVTTCMDYKNGIYNESLTSNFDANKKIIFVKNKHNKIIARSIIKLTKIRTGSLDNNNLKKDFAIIIERVYSSDTTVNVGKIIYQFVKKHYNNITLLAKSNLCEKQIKQTDTNVFITYSRNKSQYFDSLGGKINQDDMGQYKNHKLFIL